MVVLVLVVSIVITVLGNFGGDCWGVWCVGLFSVVGMVTALAKSTRKQAPHSNTQNHSTHADQ